MSYFIKKIGAFIFVSLFGMMQGNSQTVLMANGLQTVCAGNFESSTSFSSTGAGYANNENFTMTFCPGTAGSVVTMNFATCVIGAGDMLLVYNGNSTAAPLLSTFDVTNPAVGIVAAQLVANASGCLTFHFISDAAGLGNGWNAFISCDIPCQPFTIEATSFTPDTVLGGFIDICVIDTARIEVTGIYPNNNLNYNQNDSNINFYWYLDSNVIDSGSTLGFLPDSGGAFLVQVFATDSLGCDANFNLNYWVRVSTEPSFAPSFLASDTICLGETNTLTYGAISQTWSNADSSNAVPTTFLPDGTGSNPGVYVNTLTFSKFQTGKTITSLADINKFWAIMEHTFLGDLTITMSCPNGSSAVLKSFPGGGGTNLGEPCNGTGIGVGYLYEWKSTGNNQTNLSAFACGCPVVISPCSGVGIGASMPANSYAPFQTMSNLIGCPLNGTWSLTITDQWASDDGYLFSWGVDLDSSLYPNTVITYNPGIDSLWVDTALNSVNTIVSNGVLEVLPQVDSATYCYTVNVMDGFGCTHDSTFCFFVRDRCDPACYIPQSPVFTKKKVSCTGGSDGQVLTQPNPLQAPMPWSFIWTDAAGNTVRSALNLNVADSIGGLVGGVYTLQLIDGNGCSSIWPVLLGTVQPMQVTILGTKQTSCFGGGCDGDATAFLFFGSQPYSYLWSNGSTLLANNSLCAGVQTLWVTDRNGCVDTTDFVVTEPDIIQASAFGATTICIGGSTIVVAGALGGIPPYSYNWGTGYAATNLDTVSPTLTTSFMVSITDANNCGPDSAAVTINVRPPLTVSLQSQDTVCPGDIFNLVGNATGGDSTYTYSWSASTSTANSVMITATISQFYMVTLTDGCTSPPVIDSVWVQVGGYPAIQVSVNKYDTICQGEQFFITAQGDGGIGQYTYEWDQGLGFGQNQSDMPSSPTTYSVTVTDECFTLPGYADIQLEFGDYDGYSLWVDTNKNCDPATFAFAWDTVNASFEYFIDYGKGFRGGLGLDTTRKEFKKDGCHDITAKLITKYGCISTKSYPCFIEVIPSPTASFDFNSHKPNVIDHYVDFWDRSIGASSWTWYSNDIFLNDNEKFSAPFPESETFNIKIVVANDFGCVDSTDTDLTVREVTTYFYPSAFTPNGDGNNDVFKIVGKGVRTDDYNLIIYDRWGGIVFNGKSRDQGWNGKELNTGKELPVGSYNYYYSLKLHTGRKYSNRGSVTLLR